ncbi:unnamed protein product, partial [Ectocarpus sp. 8 AP-2014]
VFASARERRTTRGETRTSTTAFGAPPSYPFSTSCTSAPPTSPRRGRKKKNKMKNKMVDVSTKHPQPSQALLLAWVEHLMDEEVPVEK